MEDLMEKIVARVSRGGPAVPMRRETLPPGLLEESMEPASYREDPGGSEAYEALFTQIHRESVRCYRNTEAVVKSSSEALREASEVQAGALKDILNRQQEDFQSELSETAEALKAELRKETEALRETFEKERLERQSEQAESLIRKRIDGMRRMIIASLILGTADFIMLAGLVLHFFFGII